MSLNNGERQVAPTLTGIRNDHTARYRFAATLFNPGDRIIDFACGIGYGCRILADAGLNPTGMDKSFEAIAYGNTHYNADGKIRLEIGNGDNPGDIGEYDAAVCFETIEHIEDPRPLLLALRKAAPTLVCSVPNEDVMPYEYAPGKVYAFHYRHYRKNEFYELLRACGWAPVDWYGQTDDASDVEHDNDGRTLIAVCKRCEVPEVVNTEERHIAILGLGPSINQYLELTKRLGGKSNFCTETWAINALGDVFNADLIFHMDDVRIQEIRAAANPNSNIAAMVKWLKTTKTPVVTSKAHPHYPALVEYPLEEVINALGHAYFNSTAAYAIAYAIYTGATKISLFGLDFTYANIHHGEKGRACCEFWIGVAHSQGINVVIPKTSSMMDSMHSQSDRLYGYDCVDVEFHTDVDGYLRLNFKNKTTLPTAEEIEKNYDHSAPIAEQHLSLG